MSRGLIASSSSAPLRSTSLAQTFRTPWNHCRLCRADMGESRDYDALSIHCGTKVHPCKLLIWGTRRTLENFTFPKVMATMTDERRIGLIPYWKYWLRLPMIFSKGGVTDRPMAKSSARAATMSGISTTGHRANHRLRYVVDRPASGRGWRANWRGAGWTWCCWRAARKIWAACRWSARRTALTRGWFC